MALLSQSRAMNLSKSIADRVAQIGYKDDMGALTEYRWSDGRGRDERLSIVVEDRRGLSSPNTALKIRMRRFDGHPIVRVIDSTEEYGLTGCVRKYETQVILGDEDVAAPATDTLTRDIIKLLGQDEAQNHYEMLLGDVQRILANTKK
ncbi:MAG: hypothetical protein HY366_03215 [Candidatus Aenigmarchaeota archaeon]|nr:hypothetical protein [Candidatus Aenigmarchaeota archaeon]